MCKTVCGDDIVTPTRSHHMLNALIINDNLADKSFHPLLSNKITHAASEHHKKLCSFSPLLKIARAVVTISAKVVRGNSLKGQEE